MYFYEFLFIIKSKSSALLEKRNSSLEKKLFTLENLENSAINISFHGTRAQHQILEKFDSRHKIPF